MWWRSRRRRRSGRDVQLLLGPLRTWTMLRIYSGIIGNALAIFGTLTSGLSQSPRRIGMFGTSSTQLRAVFSRPSFCAHSVSPARNFRQRVHRSHRCCRAFVSCRLSITVRRYSSTAICQEAGIGTIPFRKFAPARSSYICCVSLTSTSLAIATSATTRCLFTHRPHIPTRSAERHLSSSTMREFYSVRRPPNLQALR